MKKLAYTILFISILVCIPSTAWCETINERSQPNDSKVTKDSVPDFNEMSKQMTPMFGNMVESMMEGKLKVFAQPETTILLAKFVKNFYDSLIKEGFSKEEALQIVTSFGFPATQ